MALFLFPGLAVVAIGLLSYAITASNYYYSQAHVQGFWQGFLKYIGGGFLSSVLGSAARLFTQVVSNFMSRAFAAVDAPVGTAFHYLGTEVKAAADTALQFSAFALTLAQAVTGQISWHEVNTALRVLRQTIAGVEHRVLESERAAARAEQRAVASVTHVVYPRLGRLEHDIERTIPREITDLREKVKTLEDAAIHSARWLKTHEKSLAATTFVGAVAWALSRIGLGGINCNSLKDALRNRKCGLWSGLESLLGLFVDTLILVDLCSIIPDAVKFFGKVVGPLTGLITQAANAVCAASNPKWTNPDVAAGPRPPAQAFDPTSLAAGG